MGSDKRTIPTEAPTHVALGQRDTFERCHIQSTKCISREEKHVQRRLKEHLSAYGVPVIFAADAFAPMIDITVNSAEMLL